MEVTRTGTDEVENTRTMCAVARITTALADPVSCFVMDFWTLESEIPADGSWSTTVE